MHASWDPKSLRSPFLCSTFAEPPPQFSRTPRANGERREEGRSRSLSTWVRSELSWIPTLGGLLIDGSVLGGLHNEDPRAWRPLGSSKLCEHPLLGQSRAAQAQRASDFHLFARVHNRTCGVLGFVLVFQTLKVRRKVKHCAS